MNSLLNWYYKILKLLKPKYYNKITIIILVAAVGLFLQPLWSQLIVIYCQLNKMPTLINENDPIFGIIIIILALTYNTIHRWFELKHLPKSKPAHEIVKNKVFETFELMCQDIYLLQKDNEYIFKTFGPNSGAAYPDETLRKDFTMWHHLKVNSIIPNNNILLEIIESNQARIPISHLPLFNKMKSHLLAFKKHVEDITFDYSQFQFPQEFPKIIEDICYKSAQQNSNLANEIKWLRRKVSRIDIISAYLFGSVAIIPEKAFDTDLILFYKPSDRSKKRILNMRESFRIIFKKDLHITQFTNEQKDEFDSFLNFNEHKIDILNG